MRTSSFDGISWATRGKSGSLSKKDKKPWLSWITLLHNCLVTALPLLQARGVMTRNDLHAVLRFSSCSGRALQRFSNHLSSFWSFFLDTRSQMRCFLVLRLGHRCRHVPREQPKPLQSLWHCRTAEVETWSVCPRWECRRSKRVREVRVLVDQSGDEPLLSSRCVSREHFSRGKWSRHPNKCTVHFWFVRQTDTSDYCAICLPGCHVKFVIIFFLCFPSLLFPLLLYDL